jgi:hypothetical protein
MLVAHPFSLSCIHLLYSTNQVLGAIMYSFRKYLDFWCLNMRVELIYNRNFYMYSITRVVKYGPGFMMSHQNKFSVESDPYFIIMVHARVVAYTDTEDHKVVCSQKCCSYVTSYHNIYFLNDNR